MQRAPAHLILLSVMAVLIVALPAPAAAQDGLILIVNEVTAQPVPGEAAYTVTAYVTVTDSAGQLVTGLAAENFAVSQDGIGVTLDSVAIAERYAAIVLVMDISGSMASQGKMEAAREAAIRFLDSMEQGDQVAVIYFNDEVVVGQNFSEDRQAAATIIALLEAKPQSGTCLYDAAYSGITLATGAPPGQRAVLLLTDGIDELPDLSGPCSTHDSADVIALASGGATRVPVYTIGVGDRVNADDLATIAASTGGGSWLAPTSAEIASLFEALAAQIKNQLALTYRTETTSGEHTLTVTVTHNGTTAVATRSFLAPELPPLLSLSGLDEGALLTGRGTIRATANGNTQITMVTFLLDGQELVEDSIAPFEATLDSAEIAPGRHELVASATLSDGSILEEQLSFEVSGLPATQEARPATTVEAEAVPATGSILGNPLALGGAALAVVVLALGVFLVIRRQTGIPARGGTPVARRRVAAPADAMTMNVGEGFATLMVEESLSLDAGHLFVLSGDVVRIGRGADNDVAVPDAPVSRHQAEIRREGKSFRVYDLGSTYGTFVGSKKVTERGLEIMDGDLLRLGTHTSLRFAVLRPPRGASPGDLTMDVPTEPGNVLAEPPDTVQGRAMDDGTTIPIERGGQIEIALDAPPEDGSTIPVRPNQAETKPGRPLKKAEADDDDCGTVEINH